MQHVTRTPWRRLVRRRLTSIALVLTFLLVGVMPSRAQDPKPAQVGDQTPVPDPQDAPWWQRIRFTGDFRARFETFREEGLEDRNRARIRARFNFETDVNPEITVGLRLATGNPLDPTTANQTFKSFLTRPPISIHRAYLTYAPKAISGLKVGAGMFEPPITMTNQIWDDNISWEGAWQQFGRTPTSGFGAKVTASQIVLSEVEEGPDAMVFAESGEVGYQAGGRSLSLTVTDFKYKNPDQVAVAVYTGALDTRNSNLSRFDAAGNVIGFVSGFHLMDIVARAELPTGHKDYPITLTADLVKNLDAINDQDTGIWLEGTAGRAERRHTFQLNYVYARLQQEATLSSYVFDDLERATNQTMNYAQLSFVPAPHVNLDVATILTKPILLAPGQTRHTFSRFQFSARVTF